jgi:cellulose synthase/poly-beta-1,6-N-acetylglucosamine synthase-like glycosyltransferase
MLTILSVLLALYLLAQVRCLVMIALGEAWRAHRPAMPLPPEHWPKVCVQLPVYREEEVLEQLLTAATALDYPAHQLSIVVIDDSSGAPQAEAAAICAKFALRDERVSYLNRPSRVGYKSGALNYSNSRTDAELVAVFDADFIPDPGFLRNTVAYFGDPKVAAVQARWTYRNATTPLTLLQAAIFEAVFCFECVVRARLRVPALFMGTGGVWRKATIEAIGGWREVPFTAEDLDLSYRATNAGYKISYLHQALSSCEATPSFLAFKNQQRRWARGIFQASIDNARGVFRAPHGALAACLDVSVLALQLSLPSALLLQVLTACYVLAGGARTSLWTMTQVSLSAALIIMPVGLQLMLGQRRLHQDWLARSGLLLRSFRYAAGLSVAVWAGLFDVLNRSRQEFVRTPKQGGIGLVSGSHRGWLRFGLVGTVAEGLLGVLGLVAAGLAWHRGYIEALAATLLMGMGGAGACLASAQELLRETKRREEPVVTAIS